MIIVQGNYMKSESILIVPDIGDFEDLEVVEIMVSVGEAVDADQSLITIESDKAMMEIPSLATGVVKEIYVRLGDSVRAGAHLIRIDVGLAQSSSDPCLRR